MHCETGLWKSCMVGQVEIMNGKTGGNHER